MRSFYRRDGRIFQHGSWWFRGDHSQGFRIVQVPGSADATCARQVEITGLEGREHRIKTGAHGTLYHRVTGRVRNGGNRTLEELALKVYPLDPAGKPHLSDEATGCIRHATFNVCHPVLVNSAHAGEHARPLRPGESRDFALDVPLSFDDLGTPRFGAAVMHLGYSEEKP